MLKLLCTFLLSTIILPIQNHQNHRMKPLCRAFPVVVFFFHYKKVLPLCNCGLSFQIPKLSDSIQHPERKTFRRFWLIFPSAAQSMSSQSDGIVQQLSPHKTIQHQKENSFSSHRPKVKKCFSEQSIKIYIGIRTMREVFEYFAFSSYLCFHCAASKCQSTRFLLAARRNLTGRCPSFTHNKAFGIVSAEFATFLWAGEDRETNCRQYNQLSKSSTRLCCSPELPLTMDCCGTVNQHDMNRPSPTHTGIMLHLLLTRNEQINPITVVRTTASGA